MPVVRRPVTSRNIPSGPVRRPPHELAFAAAIRAARVEAGRTQADVAAGAGLPVRSVQRAEQGLRRVTLGDAAAIAQALGRSLDELVKVSAATFEQPRMDQPRRADRP
jgi:transcriptional regulator with XRE-family HTH domain